MIYNDMSTLDIDPNQNAMDLVSYSWWVILRIYTPLFVMTYCKFWHFIRHLVDGELLELFVETIVMDIILCFSPLVIIRFLVKNSSDDNFFFLIWNKIQGKIIRYSDSIESFEIDRISK